MAELKPCPFCGSEAIMEVQRHTPEGNDYMPMCSVTSCAGRNRKKWKKRESAVEAWNKRHAEEDAALLTLDQAVKQDGFVWLEEKYGDDVIPARCAWSRDVQGHYVRAYTLTMYSPEIMEASKYGKVWRCWTKEPTERQRREAVWGG